MLGDCSSLLEVLQYCPLVVSYPEMFHSCQWRLLRSSGVRHNDQLVFSCDGVPPFVCRVVDPFTFLVPPFYRLDAVLVGFVGGKFIHGDPCS